MLSADALVSRAARLSRVEIVRPKDAIGRNTATNIQSGVVYGYAGLVDGLVERMRRELDGDVRVVATGGLAEQMREVCQSLQEVNANLRLEGLRMIWERANPDVRAGAHPKLTPGVGPARILAPKYSTYSEAVLYIQGLGAIPGPGGHGTWACGSGRGRKARAAYGFDDIALVPGALTINPNEVDISWELCGAPVRHPDHRRRHGRRREQSKLSEVARVAMLVNLLTEDNLPSYHREIAMNFTMDGPWGFWVNRWTTEENRHGIAIRDYLVVTRNVDPVELEMLRIEQMTRGFSPGQNEQIEADLFADSLFDSVIYVTFQELATRVSHRNTGKACNEPIADQLLQRVSADENLHMIFYRDVSEAGFEIAPDQAMKSLHKVLRNFKMPGYTIPDFRRRAVTIASGGVYDPRIHLEDIVMPVLKKWRIFEREDFNGESARMRDDLGVLVTELQDAVTKFEVAKHRREERLRQMAEKKAAKNLLVGSSAS